MPSSRHGSNLGVHSQENGLSALSWSSLDSLSFHVPTFTSGSLPWGRYCTVWIFRLPEPWTKWPSFLYKSFRIICSVTVTQNSLRQRNWDRHIKSFQRRLQPHGSRPVALPSGTSHPEFPSSDSLTCRMKPMTLASESHREKYVAAPGQTSTQKQYIFL